MNDGIELLNAAQDVLKYCEENKKNLPGDLWKPIERLGKAVAKVKDNESFLW